MNSNKNKNKGNSLTPFSLKNRKQNVVREQNKIRLENHDYKIEGVKIKG